MLFPARPRLSANALLALVALFIGAFDNLRLWEVLAGLARGQDAGAWLFLPAVGVLLMMTVLVLLVPLSFRPALKPWLMTVLVLSAAAAFFMDDYGAVVDRHTLRSVFETNWRESREWFSWRMGARLLLLGLAPALLVAWTRVEWRPLRRELWSRAKLAIVVVVACALSVGLSGRGIASALRNHREIGHLINPMAIASGLVAYVDNARPHAALHVEPLGRDATTTHGPRPRLLVLVVGESSRARSWGLAGYARDTTPRLRALPVAYFSDAWSCGTDTAVSLPCMFSDLGRGAYSERAAASRENLLDVLAHAGVRVDWLDNNTGSKGVAARTAEEDLQDSTDPGFCSADSCVDGLLLDRFGKLLPQVDRDSVVVLHVKGSHGPAYAQRYPAAYARFAPVCRGPELQRCTQDQIINAYDNTIVYTDAVLASLIERLQGDSRVDTALLYVSDHGESTGDHGLYLHGAPYALAPDEQKHIPVLLWTSPGFATQRGLAHACVAARARQRWSHDNLFDMVLGLMAIRTSAYRPALDPLRDCMTASPGP